MPTLPTMPVNRVCRPVPRCDAVLRRGADMGSPGKGGNGCCGGCADHTVPLVT